MNILKSSLITHGPLQLFIQQPKIILNKIIIIITPANKLLLSMMCSSGTLLNNINKTLACILIFFYLNSFYNGEGRKKIWGGAKHVNEKNKMEYIYIF